MWENIMPLSRLPDGHSGLVESIIAQGHVRRRLLDLGFVQGSLIQALRRSPLGDPIAFLIRGTVLALRNEDARCILVFESLDGRENL